MPGFTTSFATDVLKLLLNGTTIPGFAINHGTPATLLYISLHTADPGEVPATEQTTNEVNYTGYWRISIARTTGGWTVVDGVANPVANIDFAKCTAGSMVATFAAIGTAASGPGRIVASGAITPALDIAPSRIPRLETTTAFTLT